MRPAVLASMMLMALMVACPEPVTEPHIAPATPELVPVETPKAVPVETPQLVPAETPQLVPVKKGKPSSQSTPQLSPVTAPQVVAMEIKDRVVEAGCAWCIYHMPGVEEECELAVKIDGKPYLVGGSAMMDHGNAHQDDGMCNIAREALVSGRIEGDRFIATKFVLLPVRK